MQAIISTQHGPELQEFDKPSVMPGFVLIRVHAAALNRADLAMLNGNAHGAAGGLGLPLGLEWSGEIVELGEDVTHWRLGDRVMGCGPGAFSEYVSANADLIFPIPDGMSYEQAAAFPVALQTAHDALTTQGKLEAGQSVLVQGASSAVGLMTLQIARALGAKHVIGTSGTEARRNRLSDFGATASVNTRDADWTKQVLRETKRKGVDLLVDFLAGPFINDNLAVTAIGGHMINVGRMAGETGEFDFDLHSMRQIRYTGVTFRTRTPAQISALIAKAKYELMPLIQSGEIVMPVDAVYSFMDFSDAFERMKNNSHMGKIVLALEV